MRLKNTWMQASAYCNMRKKCLRLKILLILSHGDDDFLCSTVYIVTYCTYPYTKLLIYDQLIILTIFCPICIETVHIIYYSIQIVTFRSPSVITGPFTYLHNGSTKQLIDNKNTSWNIYFLPTNYFPRSNRVKLISPTISAAEGFGGELCFSFWFAAFGAGDSTVLKIIRYSK